MLESAEKYEKAFDLLQYEDDKYSSFFFGGDDEDPFLNTRVNMKKMKIFGLPDKSDWENSRYFVEVLRLFFNMTNKLSDYHYVTSNIFYNEVVNMHDKLMKMCESKDERCRKMALNMKEKYDKYWENMDNINFLLCVVVVLDPRKKLSYLMFCFQQLYKRDIPR
ncbi:hypothetical protein Droror1_Dr00018332 [Drosera rotundifolia]